MMNQNELQQILSENTLINKDCKPSIMAFKSEIGQGNARQREINLGERGMFV